MEFKSISNNLHYNVYVYVISTCIRMHMLTCIIMHHLTMTTLEIQSCAYLS